MAPSADPAGGVLRRAVVLAPAPASARDARRFVLDVVRSQPVDVVVDDLLLAVNELVVAAIDGAAAPVRLALAVSRRVVRVEVRRTGGLAAGWVGAATDASAAGSVDAFAIVARLARSWGVLDGADGTTVWAEFGR